ncbi:MAG: GIY-YIG nuclease family protein [Ignavibacteriae bacterium]|nr:GIY-YIG nuclease family protein [Ignavibacteriota bacterium]
MDSRKQLKQAYKNEPKTAGVFQIRHIDSGRIFFGSSKNLHGVFAKNRLQLTMGGHLNSALQADWTRDGADAFVFEIVETLPVNEDPAHDYGPDLDILEMIWIDKLAPFAGNVYNTSRKVRQA